MKFKIIINNRNLFKNNWKKIMNKYKLNNLILKIKKMINK